MNREQMITHLALLGYYPVYAHDHERWRALGTGVRQDKGYGVDDKGAFVQWAVWGDEIAQPWGIFTTGELRNLLEHINYDTHTRLEP